MRTPSDEQDWLYARELADKLENAIEKGEETAEHSKNLIRHIRRITPAPKRRGA